MKKDHIYSVTGGKEVGTFIGIYTKEEDSTYYEFQYLSSTTMKWEQDVFIWPQGDEFTEIGHINGYPEYLI